MQGSFAFGVDASKPMSEDEVDVEGEGAVDVEEVGITHSPCSAAKGRGEDVNEVEEADGADETRGYHSPSSRAAR